MCPPPPSALPLNLPYSEVSTGKKKQMQYALLEKCSAFIYGMQYHYAFLFGMKKNPNAEKVNAVRKYTNLQYSIINNVVQSQFAKQCSPIHSEKKITKKVKTQDKK